MQREHEEHVCCPLAYPFDRGDMLDNFLVAHRGKFARVNRAVNKFCREVSKVRSFLIGQTRRAQLFDSYFKNFFGGREPASPMTSSRGRFCRREQLNKSF